MTNLKIDPLSLPPIRSSSIGQSASTYDEAKRVGTKATLDQAAKGFEAMFVQTMLKQMHDAKLDDGILESEDQKPFQSMLDGAYADLMTKQNKFGIAEAINRTFGDSRNQSVTPKTPKSL
jgi:Rod binding domain-containing protein